MSSMTSKQTLIQNNSTVPPEPARHEASKFKPGTFPTNHLDVNDTFLFIKALQTCFVGSRLQHLFAATAKYIIGVKVQVR